MQLALLPEPSLSALNSKRSQLRGTYTAHEYKVVSLREYPITKELHLCDTPERAAEYWRTYVERHPYFNPSCECLVALLLNTRRRVMGHQLVSVGTLDTILCHSREVFRSAIVAAAGAIILLHNHPSGDSSPSEADIKVTRDLIRAGQLLKLELLDHVIMGQPIAGTRGFTSLRELGYFH